MKKLMNFSEWMVFESKTNIEPKMKMITSEDIINHPSYAKGNDMVKEIAENIEGKTFHHHIHVLHTLGEMMGESFNNYMEIGSFCGGSMCLMLQNENCKNYFAIDPFKAINEQEKKFDANIKKYIKEGKKVNKLVGLSDDSKIIENAKNGCKEGVDILFIDGSHAYGMVKKDFENFNEMVNPGGFIVFDDYEDHKDSPGVRKAVDEMRENGKFEGFNVIGNFKNAAKAHDNLNLENLNEYILQKK
jgi:predicted O-methyltransferase YrrM